jgi:hypothetical protein
MDSLSAFLGRFSIRARAFLAVSFSSGIVITDGLRTAAVAELAPRTQNNKQSALG